MKNRPRWPSCPYCGMQFSKRSMGIHQKQCIRKMEQKIDTLPDDIRNRIINRHSMKKPANRGRRRKGKQESRGNARRGRFDVVENTSWLKESSSDNGPVNLVPCKYCERTFFIDRIQKHENVCSEKGKKRRVFNSLKQRIHEEVSIRHVVTEKKKDIIRKKRGIRNVGKNSKWREEHREFIKNIREAKKWEMSQGMRKRNEGHRFSGGRSSGWGGGGGGIQVFAPSRVPNHMRGGGFGGGGGGGGFSSSGIGAKMSGSDLSRYGTARSTRNTGRQYSSSRYGNSTSSTRKKNYNPGRRSMRSTSHRTSKISRPETSGIKVRERRNIRRNVAPAKAVKEEYQVKEKPRRVRKVRAQESRKSQNPMAKSLDEILLMNKVTTANRIPKKKTRHIGKRKVSRPIRGEEESSALSSSLSFFGTRTTGGMYATSSSSYGAHFSSPASERRSVKRKKKVGRKKSGFRPKTSGGVRRSRY